MKAKLVYTSQIEKSSKYGVQCAWITVYQREGDYKGDSIGNELFTLKFQRNTDPGERYGKHWYGFSVDHLSLTQYKTGEALKILAKINKAGSQNLKGILRAINAKRYLCSSWIGVTRDINESYWIPRHAKNKASAFHAAQLSGVIPW